MNENKNTQNLWNAAKAAQRGKLTAVSTQLNKEVRSKSIT